MYTSHYKFIIDLLIDRANKSNNILCELFWSLPDKKCLYGKIENAKIDNILMINDIIEMIKTRDVKKIKKLNNIYLPVYPKLYFKKIDLENIQIKNSYTKPMIIPFQIDAGGKHYNILYKKNDISSNLNEQNHIDLFLKNIFLEIKNY